MALILNEEQLMLRDAASGFLSEHASVSHLRALRDAEDSRGFSDTVWRQMIEMGWSGIAIGESYGGLGYGFTGLGIVLEQAGRHLSASPLESSVLVGATVIQQMGTEAQKQRWLPAIASGECLMTLALQEGSYFAPEQTACIAQPQNDGHVLSGEKTFVLDAGAADAYIVIARSAGDAGDAEGLTAFVLPASAPGLRVEPRKMVDSRACGALILDSVEVSQDQLLGQEGGALSSLLSAIDVVNVGIAAQLLGLSSAAFEMTVEYLGQRQQFGRIIGSFQGLSHRAAQMFAELELARSLVLQAMHAVDANDDDVPLLSSAAKSKLCEVAQRITNEAIQMHGGIGMTDEHDIGFYLKRARVLQHLFGDYHYHLDRYALISGF